jgi:hypothetical protein
MEHREEHAAMPKRDFPSLTRTFSRRRPELDDQQRARILDALPAELESPKQQEDALAEVQDVLGRLEVDVEGEARLPIELGQVQAVADAARQLHSALGALDPTASTWILERAIKDGSEFNHNGLSGDSFWLSAFADRVVEDLKRTKGRPKEWAEKMAADRLASLWEDWTRRRATWSKTAPGGGPFGRFAIAVRKDFTPSVVRQALSTRAKKSE